MNILNDHAHMRIGTCIVKYQHESVCVPGPRATMRYQEITQLTNTNYSSCRSECKMKIKQNILSTTVDNQ